MSIGARRVHHATEFSYYRLIRIQIPTLSMNELIAKILQFVLMYPICVECHSPNYHSVEIVYGVKIVGNAL